MHILHAGKAIKRVSALGDYKNLHRKSVIHNLTALISTKPPFAKP